MTSTWFITGTSSGFGRELTERLLERGDRVAATLRRPERLNDLATQYGDRLWVRELDVTNTEQMREVVDAAFAELGRIDVVVSNAGFGVFGTAEEHTDEQIDGSSPPTWSARSSSSERSPRTCESRAAGASCRCPAWAASSPSPASPSTTPPSSASRASSTLTPLR